jgi:hypothetical protein
MAWYMVKDNFTFIFDFNKRQGIWVAKRLSASQEGLCSVELAVSCSFLDVTFHFSFQIHVWWKMHTTRMDLPNVGILPQYYTASQPRTTRLKKPCALEFHVLKTTNQSMERKEHYIHIYTHTHTQKHYIYIYIYILYSVFLSLGGFMQWDIRTFCWIMKPENHRYGPY